ncbi:hypothetical protein [Hydrogenophaga sp. 2FB]|nr:hypothetical protein [Hydrogenophaga sp. 2FB]
MDALMEGLACFHSVSRITQKDGIQGAGWQLAALLQMKTILVKYLIIYL